MLDGRDFLSTDESDAPLVVIINRALADLLFAEVDPIGRRVAWTGDVLNFIPVSGDWRTVVGIVGDTRSSSLDEAPSAAVYQPFAQEEVFAGSLLVRADIDPKALSVQRGRSGWPRWRIGYASADFRPRLWPGV